MSRVIALPPSMPRRLVAWAVLAVPLVVDPNGDTLSAKILLVALAGLLLLLGESLGVASGRRPALRFTLPEVLLGLLGFWSAASLLWARSPTLGFLGTAMLLALPAIVRAVREAAPDVAAARRWVAGLVLVGLVVVVVDGVAIASREELLATAERKYASWVFVHNNLAAAWAVMLAPLAAALALDARRRWPWLGALALLLGYIAMLRSRAGAAAVLCGLGVLALLMLFRRRLRPPGRLAVPVLGLVVLAGLTLPFSNAARGLAKDGFNQAVLVLEDLGLGSRGDALFRLNVWRRTIDGVVADAPFRGVGAGNFMVAYSRFEPGQSEIPHAHNDSLQLLAELGVPGLLLFLGLLAGLAWQLQRVLAASRDDRLRYALAAGLASSLAVFVLVGQFEVPFALGATAASLAIVAGLVGSLAVAPVRLAAGRHALAGGALAAVALAALVPVGLRVPASSWHAEAQQRFARGDLEGAKLILRRMASLGLGAHLPDQLLGRLALAEGDLPGAVQHFREARRIWPHDTALLLLEGEALLALGDDPEALVCFRSAIATSPADPAAIIGLVRALERVEAFDEAIDQAEYLLQQDHMASLDVVQVLARIWQRKALAVPDGPERVGAWVAARHFFALLLQDGTPTRWPEWNREFKHLTHQLQQRAGAPENWWEVYTAYLDARGWSCPDTALWTAMDGDGVPLFPGWDEKAGPPPPRSMR